MNRKLFLQFCKIFLAAMFVVWLVGAIYLINIVKAELALQAEYPNSGIEVHVPEVATYMGAPLGGGVVGYFAKAAIENHEKIKQNPNYDEYQGV